MIPEHYFIFLANKQNVDSSFNFEYKQSHWYQSGFHMTSPWALDIFEYMPSCMIYLIKNNFKSKGKRPWHKLLHHIALSQNSILQIQFFSDIWTLQELWIKLCMLIIFKFPPKLSKLGFRFLWSFYLLTRSPRDNSNLESTIVMWSNFIIILMKELLNYPHFLLPHSI